MAVRQGIEDLLAIPARLDQIQYLQEPQVVGNRWQGCLKKEGKVADAELGHGQKLEDLDPRLVRHGFEKL